MMTFDDFRATLGASEPAAALSPLVKALWLDARGDWAGAHAIAQDVDTRDGSWVHAYLHRKEGDANNAAHWYRRAGRPVCHDELGAEWQSIVTALLGAE